MENFGAHPSTPEPPSRYDAVRKEYPMSEKNFDAIWTAFYDHCLLVSDGNEAVASQMVADKLEDLLTPEQKAEIAQMSAVAEEAKIDTINSIKNDQEQIFKESI